MLLLSRLRLALARRPWLYWLFVAGCTAIVWSTVSTAQTRLDEQRKQWGETRRVWIAAGDIAAGDLVRSVARDYPVAMVTPSAIDEQPIDVVAARSITGGAVLVASDVAASSDTVLPPDWVLFTFPRADTPSVQTGTPVAIFGGGQRWCDGVVAAVGDDQLEIGVPATCADAVSAQIAANTIVVGLTSR